jgi:hypothetical protein
MLVIRHRGPHEQSDLRVRIPGSLRSCGLRLLFERFANMTLPDPASVRWHGFGFRGPLNLPVRLQ